MILFVDVGNTRIKWRIASLGGECVESGFNLISGFNRLEAEKIINRYEVTSLYLANVGGDDTAKIFEKCAVQKNINVFCVNSEKKMLGVSFVYDEVERLGVDRCLAMIGAYNADGVLVIDAGSAITADYINANGEHLGGYIIPGYAMSRGLLLGSTAKVGVFAGVGEDALGRDTESCVNNGFNLMLSSMVDGLLEKAELLGISHCVITGGDAELLSELARQKVEVKENLVLDGLYKYALYKNKKGVK